MESLSEGSDELSKSLVEHRFLVSSSPPPLFYPLFLSSVSHSLFRSLACPPRFSSSYTINTLLLYTLLCRSFRCTFSLFPVLILSIDFSMCWKGKEREKGKERKEKKVEKNVQRAHSLLHRTFEA